MASQEAGLVLSNVSTGASAEYGNLLLYFLYVIFARFEIDLRKNGVSGRESDLGRHGFSTYMFDCNYFPGGSFHSLVDDTETA